MSLSKFFKRLFSKFRKQGEEKQPEATQVVPPQPSFPGIGKFTPPSTGGIGAEYPKVVIRAGAYFKVVAPIAEDWVPSASALWMYNNPKSVCDENDGDYRISRPVGARSIRGYPMRDGKICYRDRMDFNSDEEVRAYIEAVQKAEENMKEYMRRFYAMTYHPLIGDLQARSMTLQEVRDCYQLFVDRWNDYRFKNKEKSNNWPSNLFFTFIHGSTIQINRLINGSDTWHFNNPLDKPFDENGRPAKIYAELIRRLDAGEPFPYANATEGPVDDSRCVWEVEAENELRRRGLLK